jgi:mannitol-specific phosphotransferase system IIBC component
MWFLIGIGAAVVGNIVAALVGENEKEEARKEMSIANNRFTAMKTEATREVQRIQETLLRSNATDARCIEVLRRAESIGSPGRNKR